MSEHILFMPATHGLPPYMVELDESVDYLNSPSGITLIKTVTAFIEGGYQGVVEHIYAQNDGKYIWNLMTCMDTPEGRIARFLSESVIHGLPIPSVEVSLATLERIYKEQGLPKPVKAKGGQSND